MRISLALIALVALCVACGLMPQKTQNIAPVQATETQTITPTPTPAEETSTPTPTPATTSPTPVASAGEVLAAASVPIKNSSGARVGTLQAIKSPMRGVIWARVIGMKIPNANGAHELHITASRQDSAGNREKTAFTTSEISSGRPINADTIRYTGSCVTIRAWLDNGPKSHIQACG